MRQFLSPCHCGHAIDGADLRVDSRRSCRQGAAIVELAVCLPVIVLITLATIETCAMVYLKQSLSLAAFEGSRVGIVPGSQSLNVEAQCQFVLQDHNVVGYTVAMQPPDPADLTAGDYFRVTVSASCAPNSLIGGWFYADKTFSESVELAYY